MSRTFSLHLEQLSDRVIPSAANPEPWIERTTEPLHVELRACVDAVPASLDPSLSLAHYNLGSGQPTVLDLVLLPNLTPELVSPEVFDENDLLVIDDWPLWGIAAGISDLAQLPVPAILIQIGRELALLAQMQSSLSVPSDGGTVPESRSVAGSCPDADQLPMGDLPPIPRSNLIPPADPKEATLTTAAQKKLGEIIKLLRTGDENFFRFVGSSPANATDPSRSKEYKPTGVTDAAKIEEVLQQVTVDSKNTFRPTEFGVNAFTVYKVFAKDLERVSKGEGKVEVRVFRPLFTGPLFDLNKLKPNELNRDVYPSDEVAPRFGLRPFTIQPKEFSKPVRVYRGDPTRVTPNGLAVCHSVTFGVSGLGHLTFETREAWVLGLHFFFPPPGRSAPIPDQPRGETHGT